MGERHGRGEQAAPIDRLQLGQRIAGIARQHCDALTAGGVHPQPKNPGLHARVRPEAAEGIGAQPVAQG